MIHKSPEKDNVAAAATELAADFGWHVLPCSWITEAGACACGKPDCPSPGKHPVHQLVPHGVLNATADKSIIADWWKAFPQANLGIRTGPESGLLVVDLDGKQGIDGFSEYANGRSLPMTPSVVTGNGRHHYFANPESIEIKNRTRIGGISVDLRAANGYVICPPSTHATGAQYRWLVSPRDVSPAQVPDWLFDFIKSGNGHTAKDDATFVFDGELAIHPGANEGSRNDTLCRLVGRYLAEYGPTNELLLLALDWGTRCSPAYPEKHIRRTVIDLVKKHVAQGSSSSPLGNAILIPYDTIEPQEVEWLWPDRIPLGKLTLIVGDPGLGKTFLTLDIASRISTGTKFPDGALCTQGEVIFATVEDGAADTIRPRLDLLDADVRRIFHFEGIRAPKGASQPFLLDRHVPELDAALSDRDDVRLVVLDPISGFMGRTDSHKNAEVRGILSPLAKLAEKHRVAVVAISHLTKAPAKTIYRTLGSIGFVAAARAAWAVVEDGGNDKRRLFLPVKNNLADATGLAFRIVDGCVDWESDPVIVRIDDLDGRAPTRRDEAADWLRSHLADGPKPAREVSEAAEAGGIKEPTLRRAKDMVRVKSKRSDGKWVWELPGTSNDQSGTIDQPAYPDAGREILVIEQRRQT
jgi:putative DNA primase/helicase